MGNGVSKRPLLYFDNGTSPALVLADLFNTLLQRLSHRLRCIILAYHCHQQPLGPDGCVSDLRALVRKILEVTKCTDLEHQQPQAPDWFFVSDLDLEATNDDQFQWISYIEFIHGLEDWISYIEFIHELEDDDEEDGEEKKEVEDGEEDEIEFVTHANFEALQCQYLRSKAVVEKYRNIADIDWQWVNNCLQMAECSLLASHMRTNVEPALMSTWQLRESLLGLCLLDMKQTDNRFRSFLFQDFKQEVGAQVDIQNIGRFDGEGRKIEETPQLFFSSDGQGTVTLEQPLDGKTALNVNSAVIATREEILTDFEQSKAQMLLLVDEEVYEKEKLLDMALDFWKRQLACIKDIRSRKQVENRQAIKRQRIN